MSFFVHDVGSPKKKCDWNVPHKQQRIDIHPFNNCETAIDLLLFSIPQAFGRDKKCNTIFHRSPSGPEITLQF